MFTVVIAFGIVGIGYFLLPSSYLKNKTGSISRGDNVRNSANNTGKSVLQTICKSALNDYPEWTKSDVDIVIWENPDKNFLFRNSPEAASTKITSPVTASESLIDMDFIGLNEISYVTNSENGWKISTLKLNDMKAPDKTQIYEKNETASSVIASPINKMEYIVLVAKGNKAVLKIINANTSNEEILTEIPLSSGGNPKLSVSPKGNYVYLLQDDSLLIFGIGAIKQLDKLNHVSSAVWVGNENILFSGSEGTFVYSLKSKENSQLDNLAQVSNLSFTPGKNGVIAFGQQGNVNIIGCQDWRIINTQRGSELKTLASSKTAITKKGVEYGYWRFDGADWGVKILEDKSKYVTLWQRY